jgi:hypothetical protein
LNIGDRDHRVPSGRPKYDAKNFDLYDYDPAKFDYEWKKNYGNYAMEELYGLNMAHTESKKMLAAKRIDNVTVVVAMIIIISVISAYVNSANAVAVAHEEKILRDADRLY